MGRIKTVSELHKPRNEVRFKFPKFIEPYVHDLVKDPKDVELAEFFVNQTLVIPTSILAFYFVPGLSDYAFLYLIPWIWMLQTTVLFAHFVAHVSPWKKKYKWIDAYILTFLCPMIGLP